MVFSDERRYLVGMIILLGVSLFAISGCSQSGLHGLDPRKPITLEIWHYYNGLQKSVFDELVAEFNETEGFERGIVVEAFSQGNIDVLQDKVMDAAKQLIGAPKMPDMFTAYADNAFAVDRLGLLADIADYMTPEEIAEYVPSYIEEGDFARNGEIKIFPTAKATEVFMLNKTDWDIFAAATGASLDDLKTWEGVAATAKKYYHWTDGLTPEPDDGKAFFGRDAMANYMLVGSRQLGHEIFSVTGGVVSINVDKDAMRGLWDNFYIPYVKGHYTAVGKFRSDDAKTGQIIALVGSTTGIAYFPQKVIIDDTEEYEVEALTLPLPNFENTKPMAVQQGAGVAVVKSNKKREYATVEFLKWFTDPKRNIDFSLKTGYFPVKKECYDPNIFEGHRLDAMDNSSFAQLRASTPTVLELFETYELYTNRAFENGSTAREVLTNSLLDKSKSDRGDIEDLVKRGLTREEALSKFDTEENFQEWVTDLKSELEDAVRQAR